MFTLASPVRMLTIATAIACSSTLRADSWAPPDTMVVESNDGGFRLTVDPAKPVLDPPEDKDASKRTGRQKAKAKPVLDPPPDEDAPERPGRQKARAKLEKKSEDGKFEVVWEQPLTNRVAPVEALVGDDGTVVTLDNWHWVGYGSNVVVIYRPDGKLVRSMGLEDFLTKEEVKVLSHTVSSIWWGRGHALDMKEKVLILNVGKSKLKPASMKVVRVRLDSGELVEEEKDPGTK